jgi:hypothetical protein
MKAPRYRGDALARKNNHYLECAGQPNDVVEDNHPTTTIYTGTRGKPPITTTWDDGGM